VVAIELDSELAAGLRSRWADDARIQIVQADAAATDLTIWGDGVLAGNLPYYVATSIISRYLRRPGALRQGTFLIQEEVAARITARSGNREYGYLSVECQFLGCPEYLFRVPPGAFQPPPKVDSAVIRIAPLEREDGVDPDAFLRFVSSCFRQKRKTLRNNLSAIYPRDVVASHAGLSRRAEELSVEDFLELYRAFHGQHRRYDAEITD
jgi:16S rRNA (adenine1518-N6/adenine1519-N6)-dimethyltransferase